ncbi:MAG: Gfo/Idh/MocA family oxidoreductase [Verrucomicrobia bacterium]|nr:Gfo/Idh/MocA family oxidoreductase [Verrucomicrobiota bacterium]
MNALSRRDFLARTGQAGLFAAAGANNVLSATAQGSARPKIKVGQIGTGHAHAGGKMESLRRSPDFEVVGVVEPDATRRAGAEKSKTYEGVPWMTEEQLLNVKGLQAVAVETEVKELLAVAARCVAAGQHIHLDKPAGESLPAFKKILDDATRRKLTVQMGYMFRYNPAFQFCFQAVRDGWLGEVFSIETVMSKAIGVAERQKLLPYRGGSMFELGCHVIDAALVVLGRPERVTAHPRHSSKEKDDLQDNMLAVLEYPRTTVTVRSALLEVDGGARRQFVVCGDRGTVDIRPLEPGSARLALDQPRGSYRKGYQDVSFPKLPRYDADFADLAKVIRGEKQFAFTPAHDLAVQETILRASGLPVG